MNAFSLQINQKKAFLFISAVAPMQKLILGSMTSTDERIFFIILQNESVSLHFVGRMLHEGVLSGLPPPCHAAAYGADAGRYHSATAA